MDTNHHSDTTLKPVRYIALTGTTAKSCRKIKLLLKRTNYYCLVDCYKNTRALENNESFYLPDCMILEIRSVSSLIFLTTKIERIKELIPGIKVILYYSTLKKFPLLEPQNGLYPKVYSTDDEEKQVQCFGAALNGKQ